MGYTGSRELTLGDLIANRDNFLVMQAGCAAMHNPCGEPDPALQGILTTGSPFVTIPANLAAALGNYMKGDWKAGTMALSSALGDIPVFGTLAGPLSSVVAYGLPDSPAKIRTGITPGEQFYSRLDDGSVMMKSAVDRGDAFPAKRETNWQLHSAAVPLPAALIMTDVDDNAMLIDDLQNIGAIT